MSVFGGFLGPCFYTIVGIDGFIMARWSADGQMREIAMIIITILLNFYYTNIIYNTNLKTLIFDIIFG